MSELTFLFVGKAKNESYLKLENLYFKRLKHYVKASCDYVPDSKREDGAKEEGEGLLRKIGAGDYVILLDEKGTSLSTTGLSQEFQKFYNQSRKKIVFVVGGAYGLSGDVKKRADKILSLSSFTFPHELARVVLLEQIYRAHTVLKGEKYHHV